MKYFQVRFISSLIIFLVAVNITAAQNKYHSYDEMTKAVTSLVSSHKDIASVESIGKTSGNRDIWAITVGGKDADSRHALLVVGGVEADRIIGSELTLHFLNHLLSSYGKTDSVTRLLSTTTFYIIPRVSPDAAEGFFSKPLYSNLFNNRPTDDDKDGAVDEDGFEDLNGDGLITMMRVKDNRGEWIAHPEDPRIMKKADLAKGEKGVYKLLTEGIDNDGDERWNEDTPGGVDFNRNFPYNYQYFSPGAGPYQLSESENRAVADFCFAHPNIGAVFAYSSNDNLMNPWKKEMRQGPPQQQEQRGGGRRRMMDDEEYSPKLITSVMDADEEYTSFISKQYQDITKLKNAPQSSKGEGAFSEWSYYHFGRWSFSANPWWVPEIEQKKETPDSSKKSEDKKGGDGKSDMKKGKGPDEKPDEYADQLKALKWIDASSIQNGFVNWKPLKHKDFPDSEVEIGGFKPFVTTDPPPDSIEAIATKQNAFLTWLGMQLPVIEIRNLKVEPIDGKVFRLTLDVANTGYLPTNSAMGVKARWPLNVKVSLDLSKDQTLAGGRSKIVLDPIKGGGGRQELSWLIVSKSGTDITVTAESPIAGKVSKTVTLK